MNEKEEQATARSYAEARGLCFPVLLDSTGRTGRRQEVTGLPTSHSRDRNGEVSSVDERGLDRPEIGAGIGPLL